MKTKSLNVGEHPVKVNMDDDYYEVCIYGHRGSIPLCLDTNYGTGKFPKKQIDEWEALALQLIHCVGEAKKHNSKMDSQSPKTKKGPKGPKA